MFSKDRVAHEEDVGLAALGDQMLVERPFPQPPAFEGENMMAWWVNAPGVYVFLPKPGQLLADDSRKLMEMFSFENLQTRFLEAEKFCFLLNFVNGDSYESDARVAMTEWGRSIEKSHFGEALVELSDNTPVLVRMGVSSAAAALAVVGRKVSVVPSLSAYCDAHNIAVVRA